MSGVTDKENTQPEAFSATFQPPQVQLKTLWMRSTNRLTTTLDTISQKLRRSTRRREPLINSPGTPCKIISTPVKMYSPFCIDTPKAQPPSRSSGRNSSVRRSLDKPRRSGAQSFEVPTTPKQTKQQSELLEMSPKLANELQQTQIGVYQLHHAAHQIISSHSSVNPKQGTYFTKDT